MVATTQAAGGEHRIGDRRQALIDLGTSFPGTCAPSAFPHYVRRRRRSLFYSRNQAERQTCRRRRGIGTTVIFFAGDFPTCTAPAFNRSFQGADPWSPHRSAAHGKLPWASSRKFFRTDIGATHQAEFVADQRVADFEDGHG
jgi:hypothetical protein